MQVLWAPTDVASRYVGTPQRERAKGIPYFARAGNSERGLQLCSSQSAAIQKPVYLRIAIRGLSALGERAVSV
jgi:hypothetical protein